MKDSSSTLMHAETTQVILGAFYDVYNQLGPGFLESVYEGSLQIVLEEAGVAIQRQPEVLVHFRGRPVGKYMADLLVENKVIVELKAIRAMTSVHEAQLINLLKASGVEVGMLLNFGPRPEFKRLVYSTRAKPLVQIENRLAADGSG